MHPSASDPASTMLERRKRPDLREIFEKAMPRLEPFFSKKETLNGNSTEYWAAKLIRDLHPELSEHDAHVLVGAAARYFRERAMVVGT